MSLQQQRSQPSRRTTGQSRYRHRDVTAEPRMALGGPDRSVSRFSGGGPWFAVRHLKGRGRRSASYVAALASGACVLLAAAAFGGWRNAGPPSGMPQPQVQSDAPRRLPDGTAFAAKPTQRLLDIRTATVEPQTARPAFSLIGRIIGDPNRSSIVQSIYGGRIVPSEGALPRIGQKVTKGKTLLRIEPYLPVADRTTISEKMGEIEQLIAVAETRINRLRPLAKRGATPMGQLNDLESELAGCARVATPCATRALDMSFCGRHHGGQGRAGPSRSAAGCLV